MTYDLGVNKAHEEFDFSMFFGLIKYKFIFSNIRYPEPTLDLEDTKIKFTDMFKRPMLKVKFPGIKKWKI